MSVETVARYLSLIEAQAVCTQLWAGGCDAWIPDHHSAGILGDLVGIRVQVPRPHLELARSILEGFEAATDAAVRGEHGCDLDGGSHPAERALDPTGRSTPPLVGLGAGHDGAEPRRGVVRELARESIFIPADAQARALPRADSARARPRLAIDQPGGAVATSAGTDSPRWRGVVSAWWRRRFGSAPARG